MSRPIDHGEARAAIGRVASKSIDQLAPKVIGAQVRDLDRPIGWTDYRGATVVFDIGGSVRQTIYGERLVRRAHFEAKGTVIASSEQAFDPSTGIAELTPHSGIVVVEFSPANRPGARKVVTFSEAGEVSRYNRVGSERRPIEAASEDAGEQQKRDLFDTRFMARSIGRLFPGIDVDDTAIDGLLLAHFGIPKDDFSTYE